MLKRLLKRMYTVFPFSFKVYLKDFFLFWVASIRGAKNIKNIQYIREYSSVCVLGNGPSLKKDKIAIQKCIGTHDFVCVNNFCDDELYTILKPKLYVFLDPYFFSGSAHEDWVLRREKTFNIIEEQTTWPMNIIVPQSADLSIIKAIIKNKKINIIKISTQNYSGNRLTGLGRKLFDLGFYGPAQINVLIYAIYLSIQAKYKVIQLYGADLSFHNDVKVDQNSNELFITFKHFNEQDKIEKLMKNPEKIHSWRMSELLEISANTFYAHDIMHDYASYLGIKVYNFSEFSLIDSYPRKNSL